MAVTQLRTPQIRDSQITTAKLADSGVITKKIADSNITTAKIADSNITTAKLADSAVITAKIADANVVTAKIADSNITTAKLANSNVTTKKVADSAITTKKLADDAVTTAKILDSNVTTAKIADGAINSSKLATNSVNTAELVDSSVTTAKLADSAVTTKKIADGAISSAKMKSSTITLQGLIVTGNAILQGTTTFLQATNLVVRDNMILLNSGATDTSVTEIGIEAARGGATNAKLFFDETTNKWSLDNGTGSTEIITTGSSLGDIVTGEVHTVGAGSTITSFQLSNTPKSGSLALYFNGQRYNPGAGNDYTLSNSTVTLLAASLIGGQDVVLCDYRY